MIFKCKICGGSLELKQGEKITICEYCGVKQTIPSFIEPKTEEIYNRANSYLMHNEFDKAENLFNQILFDDNSNADAYWNVLMCRYGVSYVKDPASGKYIPTCNRTLYTPIFNDENYKKAIHYADEAQKELYVADAQIIDEIQKQILSVSKHEKPFDIFISYKETEINGMRTQDCIVAQDLYNKLTAEGYKVFFSRITLEDKAGTEYEPYIYAALASSKVMITICSSRENIEAVWVKNEWSRFLFFAGKDNDKTLIPLYYNMDKNDLPEEFAHLSCYDMQSNGFEQELIRGIKKLIPLPVILLEQRKKRQKILKKVGLVAVACAVVGLIVSIPWFMKIPKYNAAMQLYYDKNYPEATWAFDELDSYQDSEKMKDKCELSWRKNVANVAHRGEKISPNGTILSETLDINENGLFISANKSTYFEKDNYAVSYDFLNALYENGKVAHSFITSETQDGGLYIETDKKDYIYEGEKWENIIQIITFDNVIVVLCDDGTVMYNIQDGFNSDVTWLECTRSWSNIAKLQICTNYEQTVLVGITSKGTLNYAYSGMIEDIGYEIIKYNPISSDNLELLLQIDGVQEIDFTINAEQLLDKSQQIYLNFSVLTADNRIISYFNGKLEDVIKEDVVDISIGRKNADNSHFNYNYYNYVLLQNGDLIDIANSQTILTDVIWIDENSVGSSTAITSLGECYNYSNFGTELQENVKVAVYDEWKERLE